MKTFILAVFAALTFASGIAAADGYSLDRTQAFPEGSIQVSAE